MKCTNTNSIVDCLCHLILSLAAEEIEIKLKKKKILFRSRVELDYKTSNQIYFKSKLKLERNLRSSY